MPPSIEPSELARRCQIHSAKMDEEGHYVTANVLFLAANEIERLRELAAGYLEEVKRAYRARDERKD
jgi:chromosomal replication initiation ATPase DnaA